MQVNSGSEGAIAARLKRLRFGVYYPMLRVMRPKPRKLLSAAQRRAGAMVKRPVLEPLLPGYMLVQFDVGEDNWHEMFRIVGVRGLWCK